MILRNLQKILDENLVKQIDLANALCVTKQSVSNYCRGICGPDPDKIPEICRILNCSVDDLDIVYDRKKPLRITVYKAAELLGKSPQFIREGLRQGKLNIGTAVNVNGKRWNFYISAGKLADFMGINKEELIELL